MVKPVDGGISPEHRLDAEVGRQAEEDFLQAHDPAPRCNYIGDEKALLDLDTRLDAFGLEIDANPDDDFYCWIQSGEDEYIEPIDFGNLPVTSQIHDAEFVVFDQGRVDEVPECLATHRGTRNQPLEVREFLVITHGDSSYVNNSSRLASHAKSLLQENIIKPWMALNSERNADKQVEIVAIESELLRPDKGNHSFRFYIAGYNLPDKKSLSEIQSERPEFTTMSCPELITRENNLSSDIQVDRWFLRDMGEGRYWAIPRYTRNELNKVDVYTLDLQDGIRGAVGEDDSRFWQNGDIAFKGIEGVVGLECPLFEVTVERIIKSAETCLEWVEQMPKDEIRKGRKVYDIGGGSVINLGRGHFRFIGETGKMNIDEVRARILRYTSNISGKEKDVQVSLEIDDPVCSAYDLNVTYSDIPIVEEDPLERDDDTPILLERYPNDPKKRRDIIDLSRLGPIRLTEGHGGGSVSEGVLRGLEQEEPVNWNDACLVIDTTASMRTNRKDISDGLADISDGLIAQSIDGADLCLVTYGDMNMGTPVVPLNSEMGLGDKVAAMQSYLEDDGLNAGLGYMYEALSHTLDHMEERGHPEGKKRIILLTDDKDTLVRKGGETAKSVKKKADRLGIEIEIIFLAPRSVSTWRDRESSYMKRPAPVGPTARRLGGNSGNQTQPSELLELKKKKVRIKDSDPDTLAEIVRLDVLLRNPATPEDIRLDAVERMRIKIFYEDNTSAGVVIDRTLSYVIMHDPSSKVREAAIRVCIPFTSYPRDGLIPAFNHALLNDQSEEVKKSALMTILYNRNQDDLEQMPRELFLSGFGESIKRTIYDTSAEVRSLSIQILGVLNEKSIFPELVQIAFSDPDENVRGSAVASIAYLDYKQAIPTLLELFESTNSNELRICAFFHLVFLGENPREKIPEEYKDHIFKAVKKALSDPQLLIRVSAAKFVLKYAEVFREDFEISERLSQIIALSQQRIAYNEIEVFEALCAVGDIRAFSVLKSLFPKGRGSLYFNNNKDSSFSRLSVFSSDRKSQTARGENAYIKYLERMNSPETINELYDILLRDDPKERYSRYNRVRMFALKALSHRSDQRFVEALRHILLTDMTNDHILRIAAVDLIGEYGDASDIPRLAPYITGYNAQHYMDAIQKIETRSQMKD